MENVYKSNCYAIRITIMSAPPVLSIFVANKDMLDWYIPRIEEHNKNVLHDEFPNAGFDLAFTQYQVITKGSDATKVDTGVKCKMDESNGSIGFYTYPRSSMSKTPLLLANHVGIIDSGYRGNLIAMFRNLSDKDYEVAEYTRLIQICHPSLKPFIVKVLNTEEELGITSRGSGGFGSTG
jgi:dUTP pyrophosphatase